MADGYRAYFLIIIILILTALTGLFINNRSGHVDLGSSGVLSGSVGRPGRIQASGGRKQTTAPSLAQQEASGSPTFDEALRLSAVDDVIVMAVISINMVEMAMNFYASSIVPFNVTNLLFVSTDSRSCEHVSARRAAVDFRCVVVGRDDEPVAVSRFANSGVFARRTNVKPSAAYDVMRRGYGVLVTDLDVVFLRNPLPHIRALCERAACDMAIQLDVHEYNTGFIYARPTPATMAIYERTLDWSERIPAIDQECFNNALGELRDNTSVRIVDLVPGEFPSGKYAFAGKSCPSKDILNQAYIIHGNWLKFHADKIYRFKDCLLWQYDGDDRYYSNPKRRYIAYARPVRSKAMTSALLNLFTLGRMLNRTAILPKVIREGGQNVENSWTIIKGKVYQLGGFDKATRNDYRFGNFLRHRLVPESVRESLSAVFCIDPDGRGENCDEIRRSRDPDRGPSERDIHAWFDPELSSVLRLLPPTGRFVNIDYRKIIGTDLYSILVHKRLPA